MKPSPLMNFRSYPPAADSQVSPSISFQIAWDGNRLYNTLTKRV